MVTLSDIQKKQQTRYSLFQLLGAVLLLLIPIVVFWYVWATYAVNIPKWDDHALRAFLANVDKEPSITGKLYEFFRQHNEHRIVLDRLVTWLDYTLVGKFSYQHLMVVGNLSLLGLIAIFGLALGQAIGEEAKKKSTQFTTTLADSIIYLPPVAFLILNLSHWENMFWGMAALQNFTVLLWVIGAIYLLSFTEHLIGAILLATAATLTSGNGLLVWPVGFAILLLQWILEKRSNWKALLGWVVVAGIEIALYFLDYKKPEGNPPVRGSFIDLIKGWLAFNGAAAEAFPMGTAFSKCVIIGSIATVLLGGGWVYLLEKGLVKKRFPAFSYFFVGASTFLLGTAAIVAWSRVGFGLQGLITSRYKIYSLLLLSLVYCFVIIHQKGSARVWTFLAGLVFSVGLMVSSYFTYLSDTIWWRHWLVTSQFNWTHNSNTPEISIDSVSKHYTTLAPAFYDTILPSIFGPTQELPVKLEMTKTAGRYAIESTLLSTERVNDSGLYLLARSDKRSYLFPVRQNQQSIKRAGFKPTNLFTTGFRAEISPEGMINGVYPLFVLRVWNGKANLYPTNKTIEATGETTATLKKNW
ncbi:hypothetical protein GCM10028805_47900 [Spirosoma harenae]